ncbi:MAG: hypothetical protein ABF966_01465 [Bifidobacterium psychraerophilum]|uniref:hypothetical protein n=1 Tax=Bifidobacterium psychraerophilum TaxID=218140 RepID=UPI0039EA2928
MSSTNSAQTQRSQGHGYNTGRRMSSRRIHLSFPGSVHAEIVKVLSLRSSYILLVINTVLIPLGTALAAWSIKTLNSMGEDGKTLSTPRALDAADLWMSVGAFVSTAVLAVGILAILSLTSEFANSSIQASLTANPRRAMFMGAKTVAVSAFTAASTLIGMLLAWGTAHTVLAGTTITPLSDAHRFAPWVVIIGAPIASVLIAIMAIGIGGICRSTVGAVFAFIGVMMIVPQLLSVAALFGNGFRWLNVVTAVLPNSLMDGFLGADLNTGMLASTTSATSSSFDPNWWQSALLLALWSLVVYLIGTVLVKRRDIA